METRTGFLDWLLGQPTDVVREFVEDLSPAEVDYLLARLPAADDASGISHPPYPWQIPPEGDWYGWALMGGRGIGKTEGGALWLDQEANENPGIRVAIIAPTLGDARETCVEGETGLLAINPRIRFNRSKLTLVWPNGSKGRCFGAFTPEDRRRLRGPQYHRAWLEEFAAWRQLDWEPKPDEEPDAWQHVTMGLRLGEAPRFILTTTPKRHPRLIEVIGRGDVVRTHGTTRQAHGLSKVYLNRLLEMYDGTRLGRQELEGELLTDVEGALWTEAINDRWRLPKGSAPDLVRVAVGVDPPASKKGTCGIVVAGLSMERFPHPKTGRPIRMPYILADYSIQGSPEEWSEEAIRAYREHDGDVIVGEANNGGDMVESVIRNADPTVNVEIVHASRGKAVRAEPVAALSSQGVLRLVGKHPKLEDQWTSWTPDATWSPDRLDASVWAVTELMPGLHTKKGRVASPASARLPGVSGRRAG